MGKKRYKPEEIVSKLRQVDVLTSQGSATYRRLLRRKLLCSESSKTSLWLVK